MSNLFLLTLNIEKMLNSPVEVGASSSVLRHKLLKIAGSASISIWGQANMPAKHKPPFKIRLKLGPVIKKVEI